MKKIINKINQAVQLVLLAPVKWSSKTVTIIRYIALSLGIIEKILEDPNTEKSKTNTKKEDDEGA